MILHGIGQRKVVVPAHKKFKEKKSLRSLEGDQRLSCHWRHIFANDKRRHPNWKKKDKNIFLEKNGTF